MSESSNPRAARPVFHERRTYRRRRLMEAARLVPLLGLFLCVLPLIWPQTGDARIPSSAALIYIFAVWAAIIVLNLVLARALKSSVDEEESDG